MHKAPIIGVSRSKWRAGKLSSFARIPPQSHHPAMHLANMSTFATNGLGAHSTAHLDETEKCPRATGSGALLALRDLLCRQAFNASGDEVEESEEVSESAEEV